MTRKPSQLEELWMAEAHRHAKDLPPFEINYQFYKPNPKMEIDFCWVQYRCGVEVDGGQFMKHGGSHARDTHRKKNNRATLEGWHILHYSGEMLKADPLSMFDEIRELLRIHGWRA